MRTLTLRPATQVRVVRITPNPRSWSASADATLAWPEPPELLDLYLPVAYSDFKVFAITIDKVDIGRVFDLQRVSADSNRDLRLTLNSSAFGAGRVPDPAAGLHVAGAARGRRLGPAGR